MRSNDEKKNYVIFKNISCELWTKNEEKKNIISLFRYVIRNVN